MDLIVEPSVVLSRAGLSDEFMDDARDAIEDAQADAEAHIGRSLVPQVVTVENLLPNSAYPLTDNAAWPQITADDTWKVQSVTQVGATYTVTFLLGLDGANEAPITRFVRAAAVESLRNNPKVGDAMPKRINSVSAEGQSLSFDKGSTAEGAAGSQPNIKMLDRYKRPAAFRRPTAPATLWPY